MEDPSGPLKTVYDEAEAFEREEVVRLPTLSTEELLRELELWIGKEEDARPLNKRLAKFDLASMGEPSALSSKFPNFDSSSYLKDVLLSSLTRRIQRQCWAYAIPTSDIITECVKFIAGNRVLEIFAGRGLWARFLADQGVDIVATDNKSTHLDHDASTFFPIENLNAQEAISQYSDRNVLLLIWPPMDTGSEIKSFPGNKIIYVGEGRRGCTGEDGMFDELYAHWTLVKTLPCPYVIHGKLKFNALNDHVWCYVRDN